MFTVAAYRARGMTLFEVESPAPMIDPYVVELNLRTKSEVCGTQMGDGLRKGWEKTLDFYPTMEHVPTHSCEGQPHGSEPYQ
jgi:hypothetical protein